VRRGAVAQKAAGKIHSDLERGFIRAEVIPYDVFTEHGSEAAVRDAGKLQVEGKTYVVEDGDILHVRFAV
jgi:ribosome-binding ATPase YchF (GTP1/OBG family)